MTPLKSFRKKAGLTQTQLGDLIGLTQAAIGHYETGRRTPSLNDSRKIVSALNEKGVECDLAQVFPEPPEDQSESAA